jgi:hypothetical protein
MVIDPENGERFCAENPAHGADDDEERDRDDRVTW